MPTRFLSIFGSYDFFAKSLPGMVLVIGIFPLFQHNSIPIPALAERLLAFIIVLVIIGLVGTLLGEVVHSIAIYAEFTFAWIGRRLINIRDFLGINLPQPTPSISPNQRRETDSEKAERGLLLRLVVVGRRLINEWYNGIYRWLMNRYHEIVAIAWSHRDMFENRLVQPAAPESFVHQHLLDFTRDNLQDTQTPNPDGVYTVIVSYLSQKDASRASRFQSRYAFCRSMAFVLLIIGVSYLIAVEYPPLWWSPSALQYQPYLFHYYGDNTSNIVGMISIILLCLSTIFALSAGAYKRLYIEYLMADLYTIHSLLDED